jgi:hypothetical protein
MFSVDLEKNHSRHTEVVTCGITNLFFFRDPFCDSVDRFVGVFLGESGAAPLEEPNQVAANLEISLAGALPILSQ